VSVCMFSDRILRTACLLACSLLNSLLNSLSLSLGNDLCLLRYVVALRCPTLHRSLTCRVLSHWTDATLTGGAVRRVRAHTLKCVVVGGTVEFPPRALWWCVGVESLLRHQAESGSPAEHATHALLYRHETGGCARSCA
jgi:hypothetical protein